MLDSNDKQRVVVTDVQIPFGSMVVLLVKWALAAIPAMIILLVLGSMFGGVIAWIFHHLLGDTSGVGI